jgi:hypothetical protein
MEKVSSAGYEVSEAHAIRRLWLASAGNMTKLHQIDRDDVRQDVSVLGGFEKASQILADQRGQMESWDAGVSLGFEIAVHAMMGRS